MNKKFQKGLTTAMAAAMGAGIVVPTVVAMAANTTTGWVSTAAGWNYYINGVMQTGWKNVGGVWYLLGANGVMQTGWKNVSGAWYYLNAGGDMATGWKNVSGTWYYLNAGGDMATGWKNISGKWYLLNAGGDMASSKWIQSGTKWYYVNAGGDMAVSTTIDGKYKVDENGVWIEEFAAKSVIAINTRDLVVNFNGAVDELTAGTKANYEIKVNNAGTAINAANYTVTVDSADTSKVNIKLAGVVALQNGDFVTVKILKAVANSALKPMTADVTIALPVFSDTIAPVITKVETVGNDVVVTFSDYIATLTDLANVVKFNGSRVMAANYTLVEKTLTLTGANNPSLAAGSYDVTLSNVNDLVGNNVAFLTKTLTVTNDFTVPAFVSVKAKSTNVFAVKFNKSLVGAPVVTVKKNGYALTTTSVIVDGTDSTIYNVTVANNGLVTVYNTNENSTALEVSVSGIKDTKNTIGSAVNTAITLIKDTTAPTLIVGNSSIIGNTINIQFNEALQNADVSKVIVTDKNGIRLTGLVASITTDARYGTDTVLTLTKAGLVDGMYSISIASGAAQDLSANDIASTSLVLTKSAAASSDLTGIVVNAANNVITIAYGVDMSDAARSAANYTLDGKALPAGSILYFSATKQTVIIELPAASVSKTVAFTLGFNDSILTDVGAKIAAAEKNKIVNLTDNVKPVLSSAKKLTSNTIEVSLSENLQAVATPDTTWLDDFVVKVNGVEITVTAVAAGSSADKLVLTVGSYNVDQTVTITAGTTTNTLDAKDIAGNIITRGTVVTAIK